MVRTTVLQDVDLRTIVLVGGRDFGRCPLAARLPTALWPIGDRSALVRLLDRLAEEGLRGASVCCAADISAAVGAACDDSELDTALVVEQLTAGTAGCLRDGASPDPGDLIVVLSGSTVAPPTLGELIERHYACAADLTVVFNPARPSDRSCGASAEIYLCHPRILSHIPRRGYSDIKETLIPQLLHAGGVVRPLVLDREAGNFHDRAGYLRGLKVFFRDRVAAEEAEGPGQCDQAPVFRGAETFVHSSARVCGPVIIEQGARIEQGALIIGPAAIGPNAVVGEDSAIVRSALWAGADVGARCEVRESIVDGSIGVPDGSLVVKRVVAHHARSHQVLRAAQVNEPHVACEHGPRQRGSWAVKAFRNNPRLTSPVGYTLCGAAVLGALLWSYWPTITDLMRIWQRSDEYSSGLLVPFLAGYAVWSRRDDLRAMPVRPLALWGIGAFLLAQAIRGVGLFFMTETAERFSLILTVTALSLLMLGTRYLGRLWPVFVFLCLMLPWPARAQSAVALPLQRWSTTSAVFCLELAGYEIVRDGNVIHIGDASVAVAEACNGLRMITAFVVISGLVVLLTKRAWWEKLIILLSSLPIAFLCNTLRLAVTAVAFTMLEGETWEQRFHDWGGYAMMPLALAIVIGELWLLARLTTPPGVQPSAIISRRHPQHVSDP